MISGWCNFFFARTPLTNFFCFFLPLMIFISRSLLKLLSPLNWSSYVLFSLPLFGFPFLGSRISTLLNISSFLLFQIWLMNRNLLIRNVSIAICRFPQNSLSILFAFHVIPIIARSNTLLREKKSYFQIVWEIQLLYSLHFV